LLEEKSDGRRSIVSSTNADLIGDAIFVDNFAQVSAFDIPVRWLKELSSPPIGSAQRGSRLNRPIDCSIVAIERWPTHWMMTPRLFHVRIPAPTPPSLAVLKEDEVADALFGKTIRRRLYNLRDLLDPSPCLLHCWRGQSETTSPKLSILSNGCSPKDRGSIRTKSASRAHRTCSCGAITTRCTSWCLTKEMRAALALEERGQRLPRNAASRMNDSAKSGQARAAFCLCLSAHGQTECKCGVSTALHLCGGAHGEQPAYDPLCHWSDARFIVQVRFATWHGEQRNIHESSKSFDTLWPSQPIC
jgi:hypothetical protein